MGDIHVFVSSCKCYSRLVNVCHAFVPSRIRYFCHANVFHAHDCHAIVGHAIVTSCKCLSCKRDHVNVLHTTPRRAFGVCRPSSEITLDNEQGSHGATSVHMTKHL